MPKRIFALSVLFLALAISPATRCAAAKANADDAVVNHFFSAIRDGNFNAATKPFSARMKALSAAGLKGSWNQVYANEAPLLSWKIFQRQNIPNGHDEVSVQLKFGRSTANSIIVVASQTGEITSVLFKLPATTAPYSDRTKFDSLDVTVGAYKLPGTLTIPKGKGPFPAVVLIQGSGPNDRDETVGANHPFADIADGLSSRGIIALRYDKRTYAIRNLDPLKTTVDDEVVQDAVAAVRMLQGRRDVAQNRIFIIGHSLGAMLAPEIAQKASPVAGIVMLAPSGRKLPQLMVEQARFLGQDSPIQLNELERDVDELSSHKMPPTQTFFGAPASYYYDLDARDEVAIARTLDLPILILHGSRDYQVIDDDIRDWQSGLNGDSKVQVQTLPSLNHLFMTSTDKPAPADYFAPGHVDASVIGRIASFIANAARRRRAAAGSIELKASAIIVAAGSGVRLGSNVPKAFVKIAGRTMLSYSLATVRQINSIEELVITVPHGFENAARTEVAAAGLSIPVKITAGRNRASGLGSNRARTHQRGKRPRDRARRRPPARDAGNFRGMPQRRIARRRRNRSDPVSDTLKRVADSTITETIARAGLWQAQTPQAFRRAILVAAHQRAVREKIAATDDADLVERTGARVEVVEASTTNIKITTPADLAIVEAILAAQSLRS